MSYYDGLWFLAVEQKYGLEVALELDKEVWQKWEELGRKDIVDRAHEKVVEILDTHHVDPLPRNVLDEIHAYQKEYRKKVEAGILVAGK